MPGLRPNVVAAKERLAAGYEELKARHERGAPGVEVCRAIADLRDAVVVDLWAAGLVDLAADGADPLREHLALVAHGGYGRRDVAPFSDVDVMLLHAQEVAHRVAPLADRLLRDVFDASLVLGHSVCTPEQAMRLATSDVAVCTSLIESRRLDGEAGIFRGFRRRFRRQIQQRGRPLLAAIERARLEERLRYGGTVFLLEPNVKRSRGTLRDLQLLRWIGCVRYGTNDPNRLRDQGVLSDEDLEVIDAAGEFLLRLRNELHFHAGRAVDVLDRAEQLRIAAAWGYPAQGNMLPVECLMRDYFLHTSQVAHLVGRLLAKALSRDRVARLATAVFGHRVEGGVRVGPVGLVAGLQGLKALRGNLTEIMRLAALANLYDKPISPGTWEAIRREAARLPDALPAEACRRFVLLLSHPARLGTLLSDLHEAGVLSRFIPEMEHARALLQFNQYHKYTVDEHCLRAVEFATDLVDHQGALGRVYRAIAHKDVLHLALLLHDLGKGLPEDHSQAGLQIAGRAAARLGLSDHDADVLKFLVHRHLLMNHLAFRRDTSDEQLIVRFAVEVGSPEVLRMLFVFTAADFAAVGPGVWDGWKAQILTDLFHRTMQHLAGDSPATIIDEQLAERRRSAAAALGPQQQDPWFARQLDHLPAGYLISTAPAQVAADLRMLNDLAPGQTTAASVYLPQTKTLQVTIGTCEDVAPGVFHRLTGALSSRGLVIRSAAINTLAGDLVLDRFWVHDPDYAGPSPPHRIEEIHAALIESLKPDAKPPKFRRTWQATQAGPPPSPQIQTRIRADNSTSRQCTILDIFTHDRPGLLYAVARTLFEQGLSVSQAKIGTYLDQVVDVFYVTDQQGNKIEDQPRLEQIRHRLLEAIESLVEA